MSNQSYMVSKDYMNSILAYVINEFTSYAR